LQRFLFDYIYDENQEIVINELIVPSLDGAIEFIDGHYLELHGESDTEVSGIRLRTEQDKEILHYKLHRDVISR
jgi:hypothetical protein